MTHIIHSAYDAQDIVFCNGNIGRALRQLVKRKNSQLNSGMWWDYIGTTWDKKCGLCDQQFIEQSYEVIAEHGLKHIKENNLLAMI